MNKNIGSDIVVEKSTQDALKELRARLGQTQQTFAHEQGLAIRTVAHYESDRVPKASQLVRFANIAESNEWHDLATVFNNAIISSLGMDARNSLLAFRRVRDALNKISEANNSVGDAHAKQLLEDAMVDLNFALNRLNDSNAFTKTGDE